MKFKISWYESVNVPSTYMGEDEFEGTLCEAIHWADEHSGGFEYEIESKGE